LQPVGNGQAGRVLELAPNGLLHDGVGFQVNVGRGFVDGQDFGRAQHRAGQANELPLAGGPVAAPFVHARVQAARVLLFHARAVQRGATATAKKKKKKMAEN